MRTITTLRNGLIYQMDIDEAQDIIGDYAERHCGGDTRQARAEMERWQADLPTKERVAIRRYLTEQETV